MRAKLITAHCVLITSFLFLISCTPSSTPPPQTSLIVYRFDPPAFIEYSADFQLIKEIPFSIPPTCGLNNTFPAPIGKFLLIELNCSNGQTVLFLDTSTSLSASSGSTTQPVTDTDAHFLAWTSDGKAAYLKVDTAGNTHFVLTYPDGKSEFIPIAAYTYDLAPQPDSRNFTFTFSHGLGQGSELWLATRDAKVVQQLYADPYNYISFARYSPDGKQIAFIKIPDTQTPFTVGELWLMDSDGTDAHKLSDVDAGHGYAANWSLDGKQIAFVMRENPEDKNANQNSDALISNIYIIDVESGVSKQITNFTSGRVETPQWSPDGNTLAFNVVINGRMNVSIAEVNSVGVGSSDPVEIRYIEAESACCPAWMRK